MITGTLFAGCGETQQQDVENVQNDKQQEEQKKEEEQDMGEEVKVESINVITRKTSNGQLAETIEITVNDTSSLLKLEGDDFKLFGCIMDRNDHELLLQKAAGVAFTATKVIIEVDEPFEIALSDGTYGSAFQVECSNTALSFTYEDITSIVCADFERFTDEEYTADGATVQYHLYSPDVEGKQPLVVYFHGGGNSGYEGVLDDDSYACAWASEESQENFACYVMAPYRPDGNTDEVLDLVKGAIDKLVAEGKVDPERIYITGESMGSICSVQFVNRFPGYAAAIAIMNGGPSMIDDGSQEITEDADLTETMTWSLESPWSDAELKVLADSDTSVMFIQGLGDTLSYPTKYATVYKKLEALGMEPGNDLMWVSYTTEEWNYLISDRTTISQTAESYAGVDPITGKEYYTSAMHNTSKVAGYDTTVKKWLFIQINSEEPYFTPMEVVSGMSDKYTKQQTYTVEHESLGSFEVLAGLTEDGTEFYLEYLLFGSTQITEGTLDSNGSVSVTYDSSGYGAMDAELLIKAADPDAWEVR